MIAIGRHELSVDRDGCAYIKSTRALLAPGVREDRWLKTCSPYIGWTLWHRYKPKPGTLWDRIPFETSAQMLRRQLSGKPDGYTWELEWQRRKRLAKQEARKSATKEKSARVVTKRNRQKSAAVVQDVAVSSGMILDDKPF